MTLPPELLAAYKRVDDAIANRDKMLAEHDAIRAEWKRQAERRAKYAERISLIIIAIFIMSIIGAILL